MKLAASLVVALVASGCSFFAMRGTSNQAPARPARPNCTSSRLVPALDGVSAALLLAAGSADSDTEGAHSGGMRRILIISALPEMAASIYGFVRASSCATEKDRWQAELQPGLGASRLEPRRAD